MTVVERPPTPLPRDINGNSRHKQYAAVHPLPRQNALHREYEHVVRSLEQRLPLRAARLRDLMDRVEAIRDQYRLLTEEEQSLFEQRKAETLSYNEDLDSKIERLKAERAAVVERLDEEIARWQEELLKARIELAEAKVDAGFPVDIEGLDRLERALEEILENAGDAVSNLANRRGRSFLELIKERIWRWRRRDGANSEADNVESVRDDADSPDSSSEISGENEFLQGPAVLTIEEALARVPSIEAIAIQEKIPNLSSIYPSRKSCCSQLLGGLSLVAVGTIFGLSIAFITGVLTSVKTLANTPWHAVISSILGISMFWIMGELVRTLSYITSEGLHNWAVVSNFHVWTRKAAKWILGITLLFTIGLILMEASVEKEGVIGQLWQRRVLAEMFAGRGSARPGSDFGGWTVWLVVLCVSGPYLLLHLSNAWAEARRKVVEVYLENKRHSAASELVRRSLEARDNWLAQRQAVALSEIVPASAPATAQHEESSSHDLSVPADMGFAPTMHHSMGGRDDRSEPKSDSSALTTHAQPRGIDEIDDQALLDVPRRLAVARERVLYVYRRLKEARAKKLEAIARLDDEISRMEQMRKPEVTEISLEGKRRLEDAYADLVHAARVFDAEYHRLSQCLESVPRASLFGRIWRFILGSRLKSALVTERRLS